MIGQAGVGKSRLLRELAVQLAEREQEAAFRVGHCPAYGAGPRLLGARRDRPRPVRDRRHGRLRARLGEAPARGRGGDLRRADRRAPGAPRRDASLARSGSSRPAEHAAIAGGPDAEDPQQMRDRLFSATRSLIEAASRRWPVVIAIEDIHWADEGMLDLIEYLARWVRGPALIACMARDELLDRRPGWGGGRRNATTIALEPLTQDETRDLVAALLPESNGGSAQRPADLVAAGRRALGREPPVRRGDGQPDPRGGVQGRPDAPGDGPRGARCPTRLAVGPRSGACCSTPRSSARPSGRARLPGLEDEEGIDLESALDCPGGEGHGGFERGQPPGRRARVRLQARADPRRRLLDPAEVGPGTKARRGRGVHRGACRPTAPRAWWRWSPTTTDARRRSGPTPMSIRIELERINHKALAGARGGR